MFSLLLHASGFPQTLVNEDGANGLGAVVYTMQVAQLLTGMGGLEVLVVFVKESRNLFALFVRDSTIGGLASTIVHQSLGTVFFNIGLEALYLSSGEVEQLGRLYPLKLTEDNTSDDVGTI
jgi:hypothetical protein